MLIDGICSCYAEGITNPGPKTVDHETNPYPALYDILVNPAKIK